MKFHFTSEKTAWLIALLWQMTLVASATSADEQFQLGVTEYQAGDFSVAANAFNAAAEAEPAAGTFQNLGNAEWQRGRVGPAMLAWEKTLWLSPSDQTAKNNLQLARTVGQIEAPELAWYEVASTWLPPSGWAIITAVSLWLVADMLLLPGILRRRRSGWQQALAAIGLTFFLLAIPAHVGLFTRSHLGFVLQPNTPLRLTPTLEAQEITRLGAGEPGRVERVSANYFYVRLNRASGWLAREQFGLVCPK
jgi:tetratricopeptide (TPR) repeat protein